VDVARQYGFSELGRFAAAYQAAFGEAPSVPVRRADPRKTRAAFFPNPHSARMKNWEKLGALLRERRITRG
jgi:AraC-like DNA-binding protein